MIYKQWVRLKTLMGWTDDGVPPKRNIYNTLFHVKDKYDTKLIVEVWYIAFRECSDSEFKIVIHNVDKDESIESYAYDRFEGILRKLK